MENLATITQHSQESLTNTKQTALSKVKDEKIIDIVAWLKGMDKIHIVDFETDQKAEITRHEKAFVGVIDAAIVSLPVKDGIGDPTLKYN
jgi:hypothetical protein